MLRIEILAAFYNFAQEMKGLKFIATFLLIFSWTGVLSQESGLSGKKNALKQRLDSAAVRKYNPLYIEVPQRPWRIILRNRLDQSNTKFVTNNTLTVNGLVNDTQMDMNIESQLQSTAGIWVGYRGLGIGYSYKLNKQAGFNFSISATGAKYGINFKLRSMDIEKMHMIFKDTELGSTETLESDAQFPTPINVSSFNLNGYYVLNGRNYSQAAAYKQVVIQRRSAGSLLLGGTAVTTVIDMSDKYNAAIIALTDSLGLLTFGHISGGVGYGYNYVPAQGWTINAMAMTFISFSDLIIRKKYDCNYDFIGQNDVDDYGEWDSENRIWANGKSRKPTFIGNNLINWQEDVDIWEMRVDDEKSSYTFNLDLRTGATYCWDRYFLNATGMINLFSCGHDKNQVRLFDWNISASFGIRL